jgi:hypothetical protein
MLLVSAVSNGPSSSCDHPVIHAFITNGTGEPIFNGGLTLL